MSLKISLFVKVEVNFYNHSQEIGTPHQSLRIFFTAKKNYIIKGYKGNLETFYNSCFVFIKTK